MTDFPTSLVPTDVAAAATALANVVNNHTDHHQAVDERLGELQGALGLIDETGYNAGGGAFPTFFDPANALFSDGMFLQLGFAAAAGQTLTWGGIGNDANPGGITPYMQVRGESSDGNHYAYARFTASAPNTSGVGGGAGFLLNSSDLAGLIGFAYGPGLSQVEIQANAGQTDPILLLEDENGVDIFKIAQNGAVGGVAPNVGDSIKWNGTIWAASA